MKLLLAVLLLASPLYANGVGMAEISLDLAKWTYFADGLQVESIQASFNQTGHVSTLRSGERVGRPYMKLSDATANGDEFAGVQLVSGIVMVTAVSLANQADHIEQLGTAVLDVVSEFHVTAKGKGKLTVTIPYSIEVQCLAEPEKVRSTAAAVIAFGNFQDAADCAASGKRAGLLRLDQMLEEPNGEVIAARLTAEAIGGAAAVSEMPSGVLLGVGVVAVVVKRRIRTTSAI